MSKKATLLATVGGVLLWVIVSTQIYKTSTALSERADVLAATTGATPGRSLPQKTRSQPDYCSNVDAVFTWVNGTDPQQLKLLGKYVKNPQRLNIMYRDYGMLRFGIRSIEKFTPWVRKIYLFTNGQVPTWFNVSAKRYTATHSLIHSLTHTLTHSHTHTLTHSRMLVLFIICCL